MAYDIAEIKSRLSLPEIMRRDGHTPKRVGTAWFVNCPFHTEKSPSCKVEERSFHCFGCGAGSDIIDYWERSRGGGKKEAIAELAQLAGLSEEPAGYRPALAPKPAAPKPEEIIEPLTSTERGDWMECVATLANRPAEIARIALWRGIDPEVISWAVGRGVIGLKRWSGILREAFLVEMPFGNLLSPVSTHIRLSPQTKGNMHPKASWRFDPPRRGSWPLIFGDPATATHTFLVEGQWDALALIHLMQWHLRDWPASVCVIAMRGSTSFRKLLTHYDINDQATVFAIADADNAGAEWFAQGGLVEQIGAKVARVFAFWPGRTGADLNDLVKEGSLDRDTFVAILRPKLPNRHHIKTTGPTFFSWCKQNRKNSAAAAFVVTDSDRPAARAPRKHWERHWDSLNLPEEKILNLLTAWETYKTQCEALSH